MAVVPCTHAPAGAHNHVHTHAQPHALTSAAAAERSPQRADAASADIAAMARAVTRWLRTQAVDVGGMPEVERLHGGMSHLTYRLRYAHHDLVLRRPLHAHAGAGALRREFALQSALAADYPVAQTLRLCADPRVAGAPFYLMRYVDGVVAQRRAFPQPAPAPADARRLCVEVLERMIELHRIDPRRPDIEQARPGLHDGAYLRKLLQHWSARYLKLKTWTMPDLRWMAQWLSERVPADAPVCLLHNDWRLANLVFDAARPSRIRAVLDWEFAALGDPLMDLGILLSYWVEPGDNALMRRYQWQPSHLPGMLAREEIVERYFAATGRSRKHWPFYRVFGLFRYLMNLQALRQRHLVHDGEEKTFLAGSWTLAHYLNRTCRGLARGA